MRRLTTAEFGNARRGSTIVEASLTFPLFLVVLTSLFDFGLSLYLRQSVVHQARAAARYGAVNPDTTAVKNMVLYGHPTGEGGGAYGLAAADVTVVRLGTPTTATDRIVVTIAKHNFTWITPIFAGRKTGKPIVVSMPVEY